MIALLLGLLVLLWPALATSETYYVHPSGLDSRACATASQSGGCTGTSSCARQSFNGGVSCLSGGDTLTIKAGTYTNQCLADVASPDTVAIPAGLSAAQPTTIRNAPGETVTIRATQQCNAGPNGFGSINLANNRQHIVFDGLNLIGFAGINPVTLGPTSFCTLKNMVISHGREAMVGEPHNCTFDNIVVRYNGYSESMVYNCPVPELGCHGIYFYAGNNNFFTRLQIYGNDGMGIVLSCDCSGDCATNCPLGQPTGNVVERSLIYDNHNNGVHLRPDNTLRNSIVYNNYVGVSSSTNILNNTIIGNTNTENFGGTTANLGIYVLGSAGQVIRNNIVLGHSSGDIATQSGPPGSATYSDNICGAVDSAWGCESTATQAALFVNPGARDYHLKAGAPAINAGATLGTVPDDMEGQTRTAGQYDIGADEFFSGSALPVATITTVEGVDVSGTATYSTGSLTVPVVGTASDDLGVTSVTWSCDVCGSGTASGTTAWTIPSITLQPGTNVLTVRAHDAEGQQGTDTLTITRSGGITHNVSTAAQLTTALAAAVAGDEIVLANGTYSGTFTTNNAGTSGNPITLRAANRHQAVLVGDNVCDRSHEGLVLADAYWVVKDLKFIQHGRAITVAGSNNEVAHNLLDGYREEGIRVFAGGNNWVHHNVIGDSDTCFDTDSPGIFIVGNADGNIVQDNIIVATGNDGYTCATGGCSGGGATWGYGIFVANNSDNSLIQGNLLLGNGGRGVLRLLSDGTNSAGLTGSMVRDNMLFFGTGGFATDDCNDDANQFHNNLVVGQYHSTWTTKGNLDGNKGHHVLKHNTLILTPFSRSGAAVQTGGCPEQVLNYKIQNTIQDNVFYSADPTNAGSGDHFLWLVAGQGGSPSSIAVGNHNLFWAAGATGTWTAGYTFGAQDIHATGSPPTFVNPTQGNYTLAVGSPGKNAASDGQDMGIAWNASLKQQWVANAFALPTQETTGLTGDTATAFTVSPAHAYQVWFYIPNSPCAQSAEQFTVEGTTTDLIRNITTLTTGGEWVQPEGPARYITLGRHRAADGTLNVSWQHAGCVERVFLRQLPTVTEAYQWIAATRSGGITHNVSTAAQLTTALAAAVAGDEIVLANGTYSGEFTINGNAGTASQPITIRAANKHQAILVGTNVCDRFQEGFIVQEQYWIIKDLKFQDHGRAISVYADHVEIAHNVIEHYLAEGIRVDGDGAPGSRVQFANIHHNVVAHQDTTCAATETAIGIFLVRNADTNSVTDNILVGTGDNGYTCANEGGCVGTKNGYGMLLQQNADDNLIQGNLFLANQGKGVFRILGTETESTSVDRNLVRDNAFLFGEGAVATDDCVDDANQFLNNISYGNYDLTWYTKGNKDGTKGHHTIRHNLFYVTDFSRMGLGMWTGGEPFCSNTAGFSYKIANTFQDNLLYSNGTMTGAVDSHILLDQRCTNAQCYALASHNMFWALGSAATWTSGYTFHATDIHSTGSQPLFTNAAAGDFSLAAGSPGKTAASDGTDIGIQYNASLKKPWLARAFSLPTQLADPVTTSAAFTVSPAHWYQIWFYLPEPAFTGVETFTVEGSARQRSVGLLDQGGTFTKWTQASGTARWITLGRARATDGTLNITWSNASSANKIFIRQLPTAAEAYQWIVEPVGPPDPPLNLTATPRHTGLFLAR